MHLVERLRVEKFSQALFQGLRAAEIFLPPIFLPENRPKLRRDTPPEIKKTREEDSLFFHLLRLPKLSRCYWTQSQGNVVG